MNIIQTYQCKKTDKLDDLTLLTQFLSVLKLKRLNPNSKVIFYTDSETNNRIPALYTVALNNNSNFENGLEDGDIIISIKDAEARWNTLLASVNSISPGDILELKIIRSNEQLDLNLVTKERPNRPQAL